MSIQGESKVITTSSGSMTLTQYKVFPGITLTYRDAHTLSCTAPAAYSDTRLLELNHCREGRMEQHYGRLYYYLSAGDMSVCRASAAGSEIYFPTSNYHGISILIDPAAASECMTAILGEDGADPSLLPEKFCPGGECFIIRSAERLEHIFSELYTVPESIRSGYLKVKMLELLLFLCSLDTDADPNSARLRSCSQSQVKLAKEVCSFVCTHISSHITIDQLAEQFGVSPTYLKSSFKSVYGSSVYAFVRTQKMLTAARLLQETDRTILDIAGECGYDNGSKFSQAFSSVMGSTPSEFRRLKRAKLESLRLERRNIF